METPLNNALFDALYAQGYAVVPHFLPEFLRDALYTEACTLYHNQSMYQASIGQGPNNQVAIDIRGDFIHWLNGSTPAQKTFFKLMHAYQQHLNRIFYLGINNYEAHFALYPKGRYYKRHWDNFHGRGNRIVTTVFYLNPQWHAEWGGQLRLYAQDEQTVLEEITPQPGLLATFISSEIPHEVLPTRRPRISIAGWLRRN